MVAWDLVRPDAIGVAEGEVDLHENFHGAGYIWLKNVAVQAVVLALADGTVNEVSRCGVEGSEFAALLRSPLWRVAWVDHREAHGGRVLTSVPRSVAARAVFSAALCL